MKLFLSHIAEEAPAAQSLRPQLLSALPGLDVFVSSVDVSLGDRWLREVDEAMCCGGCSTGWPDGGD